MILLTSTSDIIRIVTGIGGAALDVHASWVDKTGASAPYNFAGGRTNTASITTAVTTTVVAAPAASTERSLRQLTVCNTHATVTETVTIEHFDGTTAESLCQSISLAPSEVIRIDAAGVLTHLDANGGPYVGTGPIATQADMEAGTSTTVMVTPGRLHFHQGVAKAIVFTTGTTTPATQTPPTYNTTSITDTGVGRLTWTIANDFSSANWACIVSGIGISTTLTAIANANTFYVRTATIAAGSVEVNCRDATAITNALADPSGYACAGFGDL